MHTTTQLALITLFNVLLLALAMWLVGRARGRHGVHAPATTGHPDFERAFRAHQNTIEATVMFLPALWIAASFVDGAVADPRIALALGWAWLVGRTWYLFAYVRAGGNRGPGFMIGALANLGLVLLGLWGQLPRSLPGG